MEKKQLNLNQPLLSVRRFTSTIASVSDNTENSSVKLPYLASYKSELSSGPVRNAGAVPFQWEKTPGKPKDISVIEREKEGGSDSDDGDESFQDARDTLSRTESFFMRSSMSSDDREVEVRPNRRLSSDGQGRDFMIDRFLPAAKAMISETPQCASKKEGFGQGQQKQMWKIGSSEKLSPVNQHKPKSVRYREVRVFESDDSGNCTTNTAACGLFPQFRALNPMAGVRMENKVQSNAGCGSTVSPFETPKEEHARPSYRRGCRESLVCESPAVEKTLYVDFIHRTKFETNHNGDDFEALKRDSDIYENLSVDSLLENNRGLDDVNVKRALEAKFSQTLDSPFLVRSENPNSGMQVDSEKLGIQVRYLNQDSVSISSPKMVECRKIYYEKLIKDSAFDIKRQPSAKLIDREQTMEYDKKIDLESQYGLTLGHQELTGTTSFFEIPLILPSLKAPSESWLTRTLPAISTKNTSSKPKPCCKYIYRTASLYPSQV
ncbi:uncharacterized protein LOC131626727 [Vicia villosa]|uniref:uncharacterized protein LOC131626727 n=1 Tax=Vicia villosa TaxID=3911 RepID=UPI00273B373C|nr:uncharacterized protein LOC131626727 [Vicia villosa]XP_058753546.1 uncharacterized protein LOC131626727 [Vicia villosa]